MPSRGSAPSERTEAARPAVDRPGLDRVAGIGLAVVLLALAVLALLSALATSSASHRATQMTLLSDTYQRAKFAVGEEESLERKYRLEPGLDVRRRFDRASAEVVAALRTAQRTEPKDRQVIAGVLARHASYLEALGRMFAAVDAHDPALVLKIDGAEVDPQFSGIEAVVNREATYHRDEALASLRALGRTEHAVVFATPIGLVLGLGLLGLFSLLLIRSRRRADLAQRAEMDRLQEVGERLRSLDEMKTSILHAVSHELRTPLTSVLGLALTLQRVEEDGLELSQAERADLLARLSANARKLERLLSEILDLDRLERGILEPRFASTDLLSLVTRVAASLEFDGHPLRISGEPLVLSVDPAKVERIVENLLGNAARHTPSGTPVHLSVARFEQGALIAVEDEGEGVPDDLKREIFEPFRQGPSRAPHAPGTGIGLALVSQFAGLHRGKAWVEDRPGGGASFRVYLPNGRSPQPVP